MVLFSLYVNVDTELWNCIFWAEVFTEMQIFKHLKMWVHVRPLDPILNLILFCHCFLKSIFMICIASVQWFRIWVKVIRVSYILNRLRNIVIKLWLASSEIQFDFSKLGYLSLWEDEEWQAVVNPLQNLKSTTMELSAECKRMLQEK